MSWVWSDEWSPERLARDLKNALLPLRLRLESVLLEGEADSPNRTVEGIALDLVALFRKLFRQLFYQHFGENWLRDAVPPDDQKALADRWIDQHREQTEFDYSELPLFQKLAKKHWGLVFEPFLFHCSYSAKTKRPMQEFVDLIGALIPIRNAVAHRRRPLTSEECKLVVEVYERLVERQDALSGYFSGRSE
jgi:hypothetical protein